MRIKKFIAFSLAALPFVCWAMAGQAASFDCTKATTVVEKMICADAGFSKLDDQMSRAYNAALQRCENEDKAQLQSAQRHWLKKRNKCADGACVNKSYGTRITELITSCGYKPHFAFCPDVRPQEECRAFGMGDYGYTRGKGDAMCERYLSYLNSLPTMPPCEVPVPPEFQRPEWEVLDVMEHLDWAYRAEYLSGTTRREGNGEYEYRRNRKNWEKEFLAQMRAGIITPVMRTTRVKPQGSEREIAILAYNRDSQMCAKRWNNRNNHDHVNIYNASTKYSGWSLYGCGYVQFQIASEDVPSLGIKSGDLLEIPGIVSETGVDMLLYMNQPYMIMRWINARGVDEDGIYVYSFEKRGGPFFAYREVCYFPVSFF